MSGKLYLKRGKDKPLRNHHPWIFSGAIARVEEASDGDTVDVYDAAGERDPHSGAEGWLARASYNSRSQIAARVWTFDRDEQVDRAFFKRRTKRALESRAFAAGSTNAYRLVNAESDGLPGVVVDRYAGFLVVQFLTLGAELHKAEIVEALEELSTPRGIYERSDVDVRKKEGLSFVKGVLRGEDPPDRIETFENGLRFWVDVKAGHKTGFYLDQRENRRRVTPYLKGQVLNAFAYTGGFGIYAAAAGTARGDDTAVLNLDVSENALELARENYILNGLESRAEFTAADVFTALRVFRERGRRFDAIVLDPPKFASSQSQLDRALRGYKDINLLAFQLLRPNGILATFSCSGLVSADLFQKVVFGAMLDAHGDGQILEKLSQAPDHPILLAFPEAEYLKGFIIRA